VTEIEKQAYFISLLATTIGSVLLIAPSAYHRLRWREAPRRICCASRTNLRSRAQLLSRWA